MRNSEIIKCDYLVIGAGMAGLLTALKLQRVGHVVLLSKGPLTEGATEYAQGGIAAVTHPKDTLEDHIRDTLHTGMGLSDPKAVKMVVSEGPSRIHKLIRLGVRFSLRERSGDVPETFDLGLEGGHSHRRILHVTDRTGRAIHQVLLKRAKESRRISLLENRFAIDLLSSRHFDLGGKEGCHGAYVLNRKTGSVDTFLAKATILATGGAGKIYLYTSNPDTATGDGLAMAFRAGVPLSNLEFVQFHPTCLFHPYAKSFLISEAVRGEGGILRLKSGATFMHRYHPQKELAPRDVVARAIDRELKGSGQPYVCLDITHRPASFLKKRFPEIYKKCLSLGIDITRQPIPVVPAAHYFCGGVMVDEWGRTDLPNLYAVGEVAETGLHGANRLASNSLLECAVFAQRAGNKILAECPKGSWPKRVRRWNPGQAKDPDEQVVISHNWEEIRRIMWNYVGIVRSDKRLERGLRRIELLRQEIQEYYWNFRVTADLLELRNVALVAELVIRSALARKESRGLHYNQDYMKTLDPKWRKNSIIKMRKGQGRPPAVSFVSPAQ